MALQIRSTFEKGVGDEICLFPFLSFHAFSEFEMHPRPAFPFFAHDCQHFMTGLCVVKVGGAHVHQLGKCALFNFRCRFFHWWQIRFSVT